MITCLCIYPCLQSHCIPDQCKIQLELSPNKDSFVRMSDRDNAKFKVKIHSCICQNRRVQPTQGTKLALQQTIQQHKDSFRYPPRHVKTKTELMSAGSSHFEFDNLFFRRLPNCLTIGTVENRAIHEQYKQNPFNFKHNHLESLVITTDSETML